jgi:hypothetical protein
MSKRELAKAYVKDYLDGEIDRRTFLKLLAGLGISAMAASAFATAFESNQAALAQGGKEGKPPK